LGRGVESTLGKQNPPPPLVDKPCHHDQQRVQAMCPLQESPENKPLRGFVEGRDRGRPLVSATRPIMFGYSYLFPPPPVHAVRTVPSHIRQHENSTARECKFLCLLRHSFLVIFLGISFPRPHKFSLMLPGSARDVAVSRGHGSAAMPVCRCTSSYGASVPALVYPLRILQVAPSNQQTNQTLRSTGQSFPIRPPRDAGLVAAFHSIDTLSRVDPPAGLIIFLHSKLFSSSLRGPKCNHVRHSQATVIHPSCSCPSALGLDR
jgi:hypothetical protein